MKLAYDSAGPSCNRPKSCDVSDAVARSAFDHGSSASAGSGIDVLARVLAPRLSEILGQAVIIENVAGAGGTTGAARVAKATPDGHQFLLGGTGTHAYAQSLY
jgi:hypothetical protein